MTQPNHDNTYTYHAPSGNKDVFYTAIRSKAKELAILLDQVCPDTNERAMAHNNLQQAIMWANAAIARHPEVELQDAIHAVMPQGLTWVGPNGRKVEKHPGEATLLDDHIALCKMRQQCKDQADLLQEVATSIESSLPVPLERYPRLRDLAVKIRQAIR